MRFDWFAYRLFLWLAGHGLPTERVRLTVTFESESLAFEAESCLRREMRPDMVPTSERLPPGVAARIHGIDVAFDGLKRSRVSVSRPFPVERGGGG